MNYDDIFSSDYLKIPLKEKKQYTKATLTIHAHFGCVYVIKSGDLMKIGQTTKLFERIQNYKLFNPHAELVGLLICDDPYLLEQTLHAFFDKVNYNGEWFNYTNKIDSYLSAQMDTGDKRMRDIMNQFLKTNNKSRTNLINLTEGNPEPSNFSCRKCPSN